MSDAVAEHLDRRNCGPEYLVNANEPTVHKPAEALDCFLRTGMDLLVMGSYMVRKLER